MSKIQLNNVLVQYAFIDSVNPISKKYSVDCIIPQNHPQLQEVMDAISAAWATAGKGLDYTKAQSLSYVVTTKSAGATEGRFHPNIVPLLDDTMQYIVLKAVQEGNTNTPIKIYDSLGQ